MKFSTEEPLRIDETSAVAQAKFEALKSATAKPSLQLFMWLVGGLAAGLLLLLILLDSSALNFWNQPNLNDLLVFLILLLTALICRHFSFSVSGTTHLALTTLLCMAAFLIFPPIPAALIGVFSSLWFELYFMRRGVAYATRTVGMYAICAILARWVFEGLGGQAILGDVGLVLVGQVLAAFVVYRLSNELFLTLTRYFQGLDYWQIFKKRLVTINLIYLGMLPGAILLALLKFQVGPIAVLFGCSCVVMVSIILKHNSATSLQGIQQLKQVRELNRRLAYQNDRQKLLGASITQTLDSFLNLVREYAGTSHEQEAAVVEITATIEQLSRTAYQIAGAADNVTDAAEKAIYTAEQGQDSVNSTIDAINEARAKVQEIASKILELTTKSDRIGEIITTINAIAGNIRMLALNATIEASGAGPFGKRFAVVAAEVNQLADSSRQAVQQIREIIVEIQQATDSSVRVTEEGLQRMERSVAMATLSEQANQEIISMVQKTAAAAAAISLATQQQRNASEQVVTSVRDVAVMIGQNTDKIGSVSVASLELQRIARELQADNS
ncbi:MAG: hypothetical protein HXX20_16500 [Chloroflexi bacterium]|nr:hypothetical protein [Chloroflexota bacterium]